MDGVAGFDLAGLAGGAGHYYIAGIQGYHAADELYDAAAVVGEVVGVGLLDDFAVDAAGEQQVVGVKAGGDVGAYGAECVAGFGAPPREVGALPVAGADVVAAGYAKHVVKGVVLRGAAASLADD